MHQWGYLLLLRKLGRLGFLSFLLGDAYLLRFPLLFLVFVFLSLQLMSCKVHRDELSDVFEPILGVDQHVSGSDLNLAHLEGKDYEQGANTEDDHLALFHHGPRLVQRHFKVLHLLIGRAELPHLVKHDL